MKFQDEKKSSHVRYRQIYVDKLSFITQEAFKVITRNEFSDLIEDTPSRFISLFGFMFGTILSQQLS